MTDALLQRVVSQGLVSALWVTGEHGVLDALEQPATAAELAARLDLSPRAVGLLLPVLRALDLIEEREGRFAAAPARDLAQETWRRMGAFVRSGDPGTAIDVAAHRGGFYENLVTALGDVFRGPAGELAGQLAEVDSVLDVGAGSGIWSLAMARRSDRTRVIGLDLDEVVGSFERAAVAHGLAHRARAVAGDYFTVAFEQRFERIVLANVLHLESEPQAAALLARHAGHLVPDGEVVIIDFFGEEGDREATLQRAVYALHLGMRTAVGKPHTLAELRAWCAAAGLERQRLIPLITTGGTMSALVCRRAAGP